jgi:hypothetical protein
MRATHGLGLLVAVAALLLGGCAGMQARQTVTTEEILAAAGFHATPADTPEQLARLKAMPPHELVSERQDGQFVYSYADPDQCKCWYEGGPIEYSAYRRFALERSLEEQRTMEVERAEP